MLETLSQGRIYVANEYLTVVTTMLTVCQKLRISRQITLNRRQNICKFEGKTYKFLNFSAPYCRESKPTSRVVGIPKYAPALSLPTQLSMLGTWRFKYDKSHPLLQHCPDRTCSYCFMLPLGRWETLTWDEVSIWYPIILTVWLCVNGIRNTDCM